ncbi:MAG TPA: TonB-dependent receptor [Hymenobacter sp.]|uniref:SusC/RagA family TonB-linked outer membrane protein n=1 Tax=Hymenobacter sp. TaxID=1898978 RepID=UPI002D7FB064|nr:TonB-dependent receptor [Hymenobacter sp.]HET9503014.1 TonB-dependent receptor [Hymenobacter sp.]
MAHSLPSRRRPAGATHSRLAAALLASSALLGAQAAQAAPVAGGGKPANVLVAFKGRVVDAKGQPLPGVTVLIKGTKTGTSTDANGIFNFNLPTGKEVLIFSFVGYKTKEMAVDGRSTLDVSLEEDAAALDDVVVVGYGAQARSTLTGAVATVDMKQIQDLPVGSLSATLQGQMPGVGVSGGTSRPGQPAQITVRNPNSLAKDGPQGVGPLYVIDNVVRSVDDFNILDQSEVESISVLKDASAAIYGARGGQGVILVTTRRGKVGAPQLSYSGSVGVADATMLPRMMSGVQHAQYLNDYNTVGGMQPSNAAIYTQDELDHFAANNTNWLKEAWQPAVTQRHALNMSGGTDRVTYFASATYNKQNANFDNINSDRWTYRASADVKVARGLKAALSVSGGLGQSRMYFLKQGNENIENDMKSLLYTPQWAPMYVNGLPVYLSTGTGFDAFHFFEVQRSDNFTSQRNSLLNVQASAEYELPFLKGLRARVVFNKNMNNMFGKQYGTKYNVYQLAMRGDHKHIYDGDVIKTVTLNNGDRVRLNPSYSDNYQLNGYLSYDNQFGKHHVSALAFFEQQETHTDLTTAMQEGVIIGGLPNMSSATGAYTATEVETESGVLSYVGRLNYDYANKYLLEFTIRRDGSTRFAPEYRFGTFPAVSAGWVISEEPFFKNNIRVVDFLKVRGSLGFLGTDNTKSYNWQTNYSLATGKGAVFGGNGDRPLVFMANNALANRAARWDNITKYNAGIDARFLGNRLSLTVDGYYDHAYNMLTALSGSAPLLIGAALPSENFGIINGFGTEVSVGWNGRITRDLSFRLNSFFTWNDNKQVRVDVPRGQVGTFLDPTGRSSDPGVLGYRYLGMFRTDDDVNAFFAANPKLNRQKYLFGQEAKPGMLYYEDIRGLKNADGTYGEPDGVITDADVEYLTPKASNHYSVGFNPSITYKSLSISATMGIAWGGQATVEGSARSRATTTANRPEFWADHWTPTNTNASMPAPYYTATYDVTSSFWFRSSLSAGVRNANVSYTIPTALTNRISVSNVRVFFQATNLFNFFNPYSYKDYVGAYDAYPTLRTLSFGLNVGL